MFNTRGLIDCGCKDHTYPNFLHWSQYCTNCGLSCLSSQHLHWLCNTFYNLIFENGLILASVRASSLDPGSCISIAAYTILFPGRTGRFVVGIILINWIIIFDPQIFYDATWQLQEGQVTHDPGQYRFIKLGWEAQYFLCVQILLLYLLSSYEII